MTIKIEENEALSAAVKDLRDACDESGDDGPSIGEKIREGKLEHVFVFNPDLIGEGMTYEIQCDMEDAIKFGVECRDMDVEMAYCEPYCIYFGTLDVDNLIADIKKMAEQIRKNSEEMRSDAAKGADV